MLTKKMLLIAGMIVISAACFAEEKTDDPVIKPEANETKLTPQFPYNAEAIGSNVYVRAGAGTAYYDCGKLNAPDAVIVVGKKYGWSRIVPPKGSFSWISIDYVDPDTANPDIGIITGDNVRVYAGSDYVDPLHSAAPQTKLSQGDQVKLLGPKKSGYYKIAPPPGAYLYVSSRFLKFVSPVEKKPFKPGEALKKPDETPDKTPAKTPDKAPAKEADKPEEAVKPEEVVEPVKPVVPPKPKSTPEETKRLLECRELAKKIEEELTKPADQQSYKDIRKTLEEIEKDPKAGKAKKHAQYQLAMVSRFELAIEAGDQIEKQDKKLEQARAQIKKKMETKKAKTPSKGKYIITGKIKPSQIFTETAGQIRYLIVNEKGKIMAYAIPAYTAESIDIKPLYGKEIGLVGNIVNDKENITTLVKFTAIDVIE